MAESAVSLVRQNLARLLNDMPFALEPFRAELHLLMDQFHRLGCLLQYVEGTQGHDYGIRNWVSDVVSGAHDAEDLVETLVLNMNFADHAILNYLAYILYRVDLFGSTILNGNQELVHICVPNLSKKIQALKHKIDEIFVSLETYGLQPIGNNNETPNYDLHLPLREYRPRSREDAVGLKEPLADLVPRLIQDDSCLTKTFITGMGGIGKTTLAQCVYNHVDVRSTFEFYGWVSISQKLNPRKVFLELVTQLYPNEPAIAQVERLEVEQLKTLLQQGLQHKRFLVVLDDVWCIDSWNHITEVFPDMQNGSRLVATSRNYQVAKHADGHTHQMKFFRGGEESWELFQQKAFGIHGVDPELQEIGNLIYRKYLSTLPLLIVGVGSLLSQKRLTREWQRVLNGMTPLGLQGQLDHLSTILALSYKDLSPEAKSCFLRLAFFPKDREIPTRKLIHIWIADGLVSGDQTGTSRSVESEAERYLEELIDKNLVQVGKEKVDGKPKACWVHPSIHELAILKAKEEVFLDVQLTPRYDPPSARTRHKVIILSDSDKYFHPQAPAPNLRSLLFFVLQGTSISSKQLHLVCKQFKLLRVLDLQGLAIGDQLPKGIGILCNLRYLNLRHTGIKSLQKSMSHLRRLMMLDIRGNCGKISGLNVLREMRSLSHVYFDKQIMRGPEHLKLDFLTQLRSVGWITLNDLLENDFSKLTFIRKLKLKISASDQQNLERDWRAMPTLNHLESLHLLGSRGVVIPEAFCFNIKRLTLRGFNISYQLINLLALFPRLAVLILKESSVEGACLTLNANGFRALTYLELFKLNNMEELCIQNGDSMQSLQCLRISECSHLARLPAGLEGNVVVQYH